MFMYITKNGVQSSFSTVSNKTVSSGNTAADQARQRATTPINTNNVKVTTSNNKKKKVTNSNKKKKTGPSNTAEIEKQKALNKLKLDFSSAAVGNVKKISGSSKKNVQLQTNPANTIAYLEQQKGKRQIRDQKITNTGNTIADIEARKGINKRDGKTNIEFSTGNAITANYLLEKKGINVDEITNYLNLNKTTWGDYHASAISQYANGDIMITLTDDSPVDYASPKEYVYIKKSDIDKRKITSVSSPNYGTTRFDVTEDEQKRVRSTSHLNDGVEVKGYTEIKSGNETYKFWLTGDSDFMAYNNWNNYIKQSLNSFSEDSKKKLTKDDNFVGFVLANKATTDKDTEAVAAYASRGKINSTAITLLVDDINTGLITSATSLDGTDFAMSCIRTVSHESAHIIDYTNSIPGRLVTGDALYSDTREFKKMYKEYKKTFQQAFDDKIGYNSRNCPDGIPYTYELYAEAASMYYNNNDELKVLFPDLYEYMDKTLN